MGAFFFSIINNMMMYFLNIVFTAMTLMSLLSEQTNEALQLDPYGKTDKNKNKVKESAG